MLNSPCSIDPGGFQNNISHLTILSILLTTLRTVSASTYLLFYEAELASHFRIMARILAHPLLKPDLTTSAPGSLATSDLLGLTRLGSHQLYIKRRTGAPSASIIVNNSRKAKKIVQLSERFQKKSKIVQLLLSQINTITPSNRVSKYS